MIKPQIKQQLSEVIYPVSNEKLKGLEAASLINKFFCEVGGKLARNIPDTDNNVTLSTTGCKFIWSNRISVDEVRKRVIELNANKSSGIPSLGSNILKKCLYCKADAFTQILNDCIRSGKFPDSWKQAVVVPIPKGVKKPTLDNIRPISLLPYPGKILEQILHKRLYEYLEVNVLLCKEQSGFRKNHSTYDPVVDLVTFISRSFNNGKCVLCIYIDLAKAFNSLDCTKLISKISSLGVCGNILDLLTDYLTNRQQLTNLCGTLSPLDVVDYGVPQGSILGPTLFNIYMNDLPKIFETMSVRMYADDTVLFKEIDVESDIEDQICKINKDLVMFGSWCKQNKLTINVTKSKGMLFTAPLSKYRNMDTAVLPDLLLNGTKLSYVKVYRYLGIDLDNHLKMEDHLNSIINKVRPVVYKLSKIRYIVDSDLAVRIYLSLSSVCMC